MSRYENYTTIELLKELSLAFGPSGCEGNVADIIREAVAPYADEIIEDRLGSVIAVYKKRADKKEYDLEEEPGNVNGKIDCSRLMLCAHMDEVGFMLKSIDGDGYLKIAALSGRDPKLLAGRNVTVGNEDNKVIGYFGVKPAHLGGMGNFDSLYIDIGAKDKKDAEAKVQIGDFGTYRSDFIIFGENDNKIKGKAIDDRLGCVVLCEVLKRLKQSDAKLPFDVYFAFTCREEIGASGAVTAANVVEPDTAMIFEATAVNDIIGDKFGAVAKQGEGPCITFMDRATMHEREMYEFILATAKKHNIPAQEKKFVAGSTDSGAIQRAKKGAKVIAISAPTRYIHTASNVVDRRDIDAMIDLTMAAINEME